MNMAPYTLLGGAGLLVSIAWWSRIARRDGRLFWIYLAAITGAFIGAKVTYFTAEGWQDIGKPDMWLRLATGKSILGGLLGGYAAVELAKICFGYRGVTGDWFACIVPAGIALGRIGCLVHGCCAGMECEPAWYTTQDAAGVSRWPSALVELLFNAAAIVVLFYFRQKHLFPGQHFHIYLIAYGAFRFLHEFIRNDPQLLWSFTGYHAWALLVFGFGVIAFTRRQRKVFTVTV